MTRNDGRKNAIRDRMESTGESYRQAQTAVEAEAFALRVDGIPLEEQGVRALTATATPAQRAHAEAVWRYTDNPGQRCLCSGTECLHGKPCDPDPEDCAGRLFHIDRYPGALWTLTAWEDHYGCDTCGETFTASVTLPDIPWGEKGEPVGDTGYVTRVYSGVRHPSFRELTDDDGQDEPALEPGEDFECGCGCWCGECECDDAEDDGYGYMSASSHCCECGRSGADADYNCHCWDSESAAS